MAKIIQLVPQAQPQAKKPARPKNTMPDGRKRIRVDIGTDPETGKRIRKNFTGKTLKECKEKRDAYLAAQHAQTQAAIPKTVRDWATTWRAVYGSSAGYSQNTTVEIDTRRLIAYMGNMPLSDAQQVHIQAYAQSVAHYAKSTVAKIKATTNRIFESAAANGYILRNPCAGVKWSSAGEGTHRFLAAWEIQTITDNWQEHHAGIWAMLMLYAGLRRGEALALCWADVDLDAGVLHVKQGTHFESNTAITGSPKTSASVRDVPIFPQLAEALKQIPHVSDFVCTGASGQQVTQSIWASGWRAWNNTMTNIINGDTSSPIAPGHRTDCESPDRKKFSVRAHDLRHTFASMLYDADVDVKTAQKVMGHTSPEITMRIYTHLSNAKESASLDKMRLYLEGMGHKMGHETPDNPVK